MQRPVHAAAFMALAAAAVVTPALAQAPSAPPPAPPMARHMHMLSAAQRHTIIEAEVTGFKASLSLTPTQEALWPAFAAALQPPPDSAGMPMRGHDEATRSPITAMQHMADRLDHRAARLSAIAKAASPLYASLDDNQKLIFRAMLARTAFPHPHEWHHHGRG